MRRLFRGSFPRGRNVWLWTDGSATEYMPPAAYNSNGSLATLPEDRIARFFQGGVSHDVTSAEAALLTTAGYGAYIV